MVSKHEIFGRLCNAECQIEWMFDKIDRLEKKVKKLEPKKEKKQ